MPRAPAPPRLAQCAAPRPTRPTDGTACTSSGGVVAGTCRAVGICGERGGEGQCHTPGPSRAAARHACPACPAKPCHRWSTATQLITWTVVACPTPPPPPARRLAAPRPPQPRSVIRESCWRRLPTVHQLPRQPRLLWQGCVLISIERPMHTYVRSGSGLRPSVLVGSENLVASGTPLQGGSRVDVFPVAALISRRGLALCQASTCLLLQCITWKQTTLPSPNRCSVEAAAIQAAAGARGWPAATHLQVPCHTDCESCLMSIHVTPRRLR